MLDFSKIPKILKPGCWVIRPHHAMPKLAVTARA
jgi:hypothetical protein